MADGKRKEETTDGIRYITVPVADNLDDATVEDLVRQLAPPVAGIVGNYADIQRAGAAIVSGEGKGLADGVELPPGESDESVKTAAKVNAAVEKAVEDSRTGRASSIGDAHTGASIPGGTYNPKSPK
jgi:hypothetical protein